MLKRPLVTIALISAIASQAFGQVPSGTKVGTLNCELAPSIGFIVGSHQPMRCRYIPDGPFPPEFYEGVINTIGLDIASHPGASWRGQSLRLLPVRLAVGLPVSTLGQAAARR
jgi:hypothetical protein